MPSLLIWRDWILVRFWGLILEVCILLWLFLISFLEKTKDNKSAFLSWIDADYWLYGLIYHIVFEGKELNDEINQLFAKVKKTIKSKKNDIGYSKTPNGLTNLRNRIQNSIKIYQQYVH